MMKQKKGQSSFEYVTIYGWALLIIVSTIGVLYTAGFLNFNFIVPDQCVFYGQIVCDEYAIEQNTIYVGIINTFGVGLELNGANFTNQFGASCNSVEFRINATQSTSNTTKWPRSSKRFIVLEGCGPSELFVRGDKLSGEIQVTYARASTCATNSGSCNHTSIGVLEGIIG